MKKALLFFLLSLLVFAAWGLMSMGVAGIMFLMVGPCPKDDSTLWWARMIGLGWLAFVTPLYFAAFMPVAWRRVYRR